MDADENKSMDKAVALQSIFRDVQALFAFLGREEGNEPVSSLATQTY